MSMIGTKQCCAGGKGEDADLLHSPEYSPMTSSSIPKECIIGDENPLLLDRKELIKSIEEAIVRAGQRIEEKVCATIREELLATSPVNQNPNACRSVERRQDGSKQTKQAGSAEINGDFNAPPATSIPVTKAEPVEANGCDGGKQACHNKDVAPRLDSFESEPRYGSKPSNDSGSKFGPRLSRSSASLDVTKRLARDDPTATLRAFLNAKGWMPEDLDNPLLPMPEDLDNPLSPIHDKIASSAGVTPKTMARCKAQLKHFFQSQAFDLTIGTLICLNALVMALDLEYQGSNSAASLGIDGDAKGWFDLTHCFFYLEHFFTLCFVVELGIRLAMQGKEYLVSWMNRMDVFIVLCSVLDMYVVDMLGYKGFPNISFLRLFRMLKLMRVLRIVRVLRIFRHLRILVHSIASSCTALVWSLVLLAILQLITSILMAETLQDFIRSEEDNAETRLFVYEHFGTFARSFLTMFEITLAPGAWGPIGRVIIYEVNRAYSVFFLIYVAGITFAIVTVIRAIFLKETLSSADNDEDIVVAELAHEKGKTIKKLRKLFDEADTDNSGDISLEELRAMMNNPVTAAVFHSFEMSVHQAEGFFQLVDDGDGKLTFDEFVTGMMRVKGSAKTIDLVTVLFENKKLSDKLVVLDSNLKYLIEIFASRLKLEGGTPCWKDIEPAHPPTSSADSDKLPAAHIMIFGEDNRSPIRASVGNSAIISGAV